MADFYVDGLVRPITALPNYLIFILFLNVLESFLSRQKSSHY